MSSAEWTLRAQADLAAIDLLHVDADPRHAEGVGRTAIAAGHFLADFPEAGPKVAGTVRKWSVRGADFRLLYRQTSSSGQILRVHHGREDWHRS